MKYFRLLLFVSTLVSFLFGTWFHSIPRTIPLPDGSMLDCFITGDQYGRRLHDENDFTIVMNPEDGYFYYAIAVDGELVPSELMAGAAEPAMYGLTPGAAISPDVYHRNQLFYSGQNSGRPDRDAPTSGVINQINVFIKFSDDPEFPHPRSYYDAFFQTDGDESSLKNYYYETSYNTLTVNTHHYPGSFGDINTTYVDSQPRGYYEPYSEANPIGYQNDAERGLREHTLLANALNAIAPSVSPDIDIDGDDNGYVDAVSFVVYGTPGDWADLLWPHRWSLYSQDVEINGSIAGDYLFMLSESWYFNVGVLCHEFFHVLGAPDLYHYDGGGAPSAVGAWDLMESNTDPPQYSSAFMKWKYGDWVEITEINASGTYTLNPLQEQENVLYKIASPNSETEYFVVEYRKKEGLYEVNTPGNRSGLLVYRINTEAGNGNASGPPDEIYLYRPGGTLTSNGNFNNAPYSSDYNHTSINDDTNPACFLYNEGSGGEGGLNLYNVTESGTSISFTVALGIPTIDVNPDEFSFVLDAGNFGTQILEIINASEDGVPLSYEVSVSQALPFENSQGGPDGGNYYWTSSDVEDGLDYYWIDISGMGTQLTFPHNDQFATADIELPFDFSFFGETYDYVKVNANGWIGWGTANSTVWNNTEIPSINAPRPAIFSFWDDLNPMNNNANATAGGDIYFHTNPDRAVIWYHNVVRWLPGGNTDYWGLFDFQIVLFADGSFGVNYSEMDGITNSATIGFQNGSGTEGTEVAYDYNFASNEFSWLAATVGNSVPWIVLSANTGALNGNLNAGESDDINVQVLTTGLNPGQYEASINITSFETDPVFVPVYLTVTGENASPTLPYIDITVSENGIVPLPDNVDSLFLAVASWYTHVTASNGDLIPILIQDDFTEKQVLHARGVLQSYLTDLPESDWGSDKSAVSNALGASNAILFLLNDEDEYENPDLWALMDAGVNGQDLLATEVFPEGSSEYMQSTHRDATYEEVLHFIHGYGIQLAEPALQDAIITAMDIAIENQIYSPLWDLPEEDYDEEYLAMGLECYFGIWAHNPNGNGYSGDHEYGFITRADMAQGDPDLFAIISGFFGETWKYTAVLPPDYNSQFSMSLDESQEYTFRSQYLNNLSATGDSDISILGNQYPNMLHGNNGNNSITGFAENDTIFGHGGIDRAIFQGNWEEYFIQPIDDSTGIQVIDVMLHRDGIDNLYDFEEFEFNGQVYTLNDLLDADEELNLPNKFALHTPYPNPFNPVINIFYDIAENEQLMIKIVDINGRVVYVLHDGPAAKGRYHMQWDAKDMFGHGMSTGVYFVHLASESYRKTIKILYLK